MTLGFLRRKLTVVIALLAVAILLSLGLTWHERGRLTKTNQELTTLENNLSLESVNSVATKERVVVDPLNDLVYLPEFRIKLPYTNVSKTIAYGMRTDGPQGSQLIGPPEADVTSTSFIAPPFVTRVACSDLVRLKLEPKPNPYSPHEKVTSVSLADGRTLQIYQAVNESECTSAWNASMSPATLTATLRDAQSY